MPSPTPVAIGRLAPVVALLAACQSSTPIPGPGDAAVAAECRKPPSPETRPTGRSPGATEGQPGARRLLLARSRDGVTFTREERILSDQANTPNALVDESGAVRVYYTGAHVGGAAEGIGVAVSCDGGATFTHGAVTIAGLPPGPPAGDPDVIGAPGGGYWLYFTRGLDNGRIGVHRARSTDGFAFQYDGVVLTHTENVLDSATTLIDGVYHMYTLTGMAIRMTHATSPDGLRFTVDDTRTVTLDGAPFVLANWMREAGGGRRLFAFTIPNSRIRSFTTVDGVTLQPDPAVHLSFPATPAPSPLESRFAIDPAVVGLADGSRLMAYVTLIP